MARCFLDFSEGGGAFDIGLSQISSFFPSEISLHVTLSKQSNSNSNLFFPLYRNIICIILIRNVIFNGRLPFSITHTVRVTVQYQFI